MTPSEARKILNLTPEENPGSRLAEFRLAREQIEEMIRTAPEETLRARYQAGLEEFDEALAILAENNVPPAPVSPKKSRTVSYIAWFLLVLAIATGSGFLYLRHQQQQQQEIHKRIIHLDQTASLHVQNRRWREAEDIYRKIESLSPGSSLSRHGLRNIETGMEEERNQYIGYWTGQAVAELEAGRLDEAETAIRQITNEERYADDAEAKSIAARIAEARLRLSRDQWISETRTHIRASRWEEAGNTARRILAADPDDPEAKDLQQEITAGLTKQKADKERAAQLLAEARPLDKGTFHQQAIDLLREATALDPANTAAKELLDKISSYTQTIRVPQDFPTPAEAIAAARGNDRILIGELRWQGTLVIHSPLVIEGASSGKTIIECPPSTGAAITIGPGAKGAHISGITFAHTAMLTDDGERFPAALIRGGNAKFTDCVFRNSGGHGLAAIEGGRAIASRCRFQGNAWNGAAAIGAGASLEINDSETLENFSNGFEIWNGASGTFTGNRCESNARNGIHAGENTGEILITANRFLANREFGMVLSGGNKGSVSRNQATGNLLGGIVVRTPAASLTVEQNSATKNHGPGLIYEKGLPTASYSSNTATQNTSRDIFPEAPLAH